MYVSVEIVPDSDKEAQPSYTTLGPGATTQFAVSSPLIPSELQRPSTSPPPYDLTYFWVHLI